MGDPHKVVLTLTKDIHVVEGDRVELVCKTDVKKLEELEILDADDDADADAYANADADADADAVVDLRSQIHHEHAHAALMDELVDLRPRCI